MTSRLLVAIPAWNEAETIAGVIGEVRRAAPDGDIVVVDDASSDDTAAIARASGAHVLALPRHVGVGGAMRSAFRYAQRHDYDYVVQVDADGQHDPGSIPGILQALRTHSVVVGSRFEETGEYDVHGPRRWAMHLLAEGLTRLTGTKLTDTTSGFRGSDRRAIALFARHYPTEYLGDTLGSLVMASRRGLSIGEVPVRMRPRQGGQPSQTPITATIYLGRSLVAQVSLLAHRGLHRDREEEHP